jgi:hypothetical protein
MNTTTRTPATQIAQLHREISRLAQEGQQYPGLAARRGAQINALYRQIAALKGGRHA